MVANEHVACHDATDRFCDSTQRPQGGQAQPQWQEIEAPSECAGGEHCL